MMISSISSAYALPSLPNFPRHGSGLRAWWYPKPVGVLYFHVLCAVRPIVPIDVPW